jgi:dihydroflavonol-4-reductase
LLRGDTSIPTALVTGGTGFVGSHTIELLLQRGFQVRCLVRTSRSDLGFAEGLPIEIVRGSYYDLDSLREAVGTVDYVFHIAGITKARKPREFNDGNVLSTRNLLEAASTNPKLKKFCFISSLTATGPSLDGTPVNETTPCHPITTYGVTKLEAETICQLHANRIPIVILRPPAVYGPRDHDGFGLYQLASKGIIPGFGSKEKMISLIYGPELARAIVDASISERTIGETYFVADAQAYPFTDTMQMMAKMLGKSTRTIVFPKWLLYGLAGLSEAFTVFQSGPSIFNIEKIRDLVEKYWVCNPAKLEDHIGFRTEVSIEDGLKQTLEWYKKHGWI